MEKPFLSAEWRKLAMANYEINPEILEKYLPAGTQLDFFNNCCYVSLVGFRFVNTRLRGFKVPFHINFEEINLRFYVKTWGEDGELRRGVVFMKEIVPRRAITTVANLFYGENYITLPTQHRWEFSENELAVNYSWKKRGRHSIGVKAAKNPVQIAPGSEEEFITEHYWGYTKVGAAKTSEYRVEHPRWEIYPVHESSINVDFEEVYGADFAFLTGARPKSVFLAEGSEIVVKPSKMLAVAYS